MRRDLFTAGLAVGLVVGATAALGGEIETPQQRLIRLVGPARSVNVVGSSGAATDSIPLVIPPGRRNLSPKLELDYTSAGGQSPIGRGWRLDLGSVEMWSGDGRPNVGNANSFAYSLNGRGGQLIFVNGSYYTPQYATDLSVWTFNPGAGTWTMLDGQGGFYTFSGAPGHPNATGPWVLTRAQDSHGNQVDYVYNSARTVGTTAPDLWTVEAEISDIFYTGFNGTQGTNHVHFNWEARPDVRYTRMRGTPEAAVDRIASIIISSGSVTQRIYNLNHLQSPQDGETLLDNVQVVGSDGATTLPNPVKKMTYSAFAPGWDIPNQDPDKFAPSIGTSLVNSDGTDTSLRLIDVDGDGLPDEVFADGAKNGVPFATAFYVKHGEGDGDFTDTNISGGYQSSLQNCIFGDYGAGPTDPSGHWFMTTGSGNHVDGGLRLIDVNGDSLPDLVMSDGARREVWLNTGTGWVFDAGWSAALASLGLFFGDGNGNPVGVTFTDLNGDGRIDIVMDHALQGLFCNQRHTNVWLNTGTGWVANPTLAGAISAAGIPPMASSFNQGGCQWSDEPGNPFAASSAGWDLFDVNGDGLADVVQTLSGNQNVWLSTGTGWAFSQAWTTALQSANALTGGGGPALVSTDGNQSFGLLTTDLNGDGLVDYVRLTCNYAGSACTSPAVAEVWLNTGSGWARSTGLSNQIANLGNGFASFVTSTGTLGGAQFVDINGDGVADLFMATGQVAGLLFGGGSINPDPATVASPSLTRVDTALGESTRLTWARVTNSQASSPSFSSTFNDPTFFSGTMPLVDSLTRDNGAGQTVEYVYSYRGAVMVDTRFRGFKYARTFQLGGGIGETPSTWRRTTTYSQVDGLQGIAIDDLTEDFLTCGSSCSSKEHSEAWSADFQGDGSYFIHANTIEDFQTDPGASPVHQRLTIGFDNHGLRNRIMKEPNVGVDLGSTTLIEYALGSGGWSRPSRVQMIGDDGVRSESMIYYDGLPLGQVGTTNNPTAEENSIDGVNVTHKAIEYDAYGNVTAITDASGRRSTFGYDGQHQYQTSATDPVGNTVTSLYTLSGDISQTTDASGNTTQRAYDALGRLVSVTLPGESSNTSTMSYSYSLTGTPAAHNQWIRSSHTERPDSPRQIAEIEYLDGFQQVFRLVSDAATGPAQITVDTVHDEMGNEYQHSLPYGLGQTPNYVTTARDVFQRPVSVTAPDGSAERLAYHGINTLVTDRRGFTTHYVRNGRGQLAEVHRTVGGQDQATVYTGNSAGKLIRATDATGAVTRISYDWLGRKTRLDDPSAGTFLYTYDAADRLLTQTSADGAVTTFSYDAAGSLASKQFPDGSQVTFTYGPVGTPNGVGRMLSTTDAAGTLDLSYDVRGRVIQRRRTIAPQLPGGGTAYVTGYAYDSMDRIISTVYPDGYAVLNNYDAAGNRNAVTDTAGHTVVNNITYSAAGQMLGMSYGNGVKAAMAYDGLQRMTNQFTSLSTGPLIQAASYSFDPEGNLTGISDSATGVNQAFQLDEVGQLVHATGPYGDETYEYDAAGSLVRKGDIGFGMDPIHRQQAVCTVDLVHPPTTAQLSAPAFAACRDALAAHGPAPSASAGGATPIAVTYDARGNVARKGDQTYEYDAENHLVRVKNGSKVLQTNVYDAVGQRVMQITPDAVTVTIDGLYETELLSERIQRHVLAGALLVGTLETIGKVDLITTAPLPGVIVTLGGGGCATTTTEPVAVLAAGVLLWLWRRPGRKQLLTRLTSRPVLAGLALALIPTMLLQSQPALGVTNADLSRERWFYYHPDHLGSTSLITDQTGAVVGQRQYKPYGEPVGFSGSSQLAASFNGQAYDSNVGLYAFNARHYDPELGRFLSTDTKMPDAKDPHGLLRYGFAAGNPVRFIDATGHNWLDTLITVLVVILVIAVCILAVVLTGGGAAGLIAAILAGAAAGAFGGAMLGMEHGLSGSALWYDVAAGAVMGALIGASVGILGGGFAAGFAIEIAQEAIVGAAIGAVSDEIQGQAQGQDPRSLLIQESIDAGVSAVISAVTFGAGRALAPALKGLAGAAARGLEKYGSDAVYDFAWPRLVKYAESEPEHGFSWGQPALLFGTKTTYGLVTGNNLYLTSDDWIAAELDSMAGVQ